jgi:hypothetical protein
MESFSRTITIDGALYQVEFVRRPFREGYEVHVEIEGEIVSFGELGLGEQAAVEWVKSAIGERVQRTKDTKHR